MINAAPTRARGFGPAMSWAVTLAATATFAASCASGTGSASGSGSGQSTAPAETSVATTPIDPDLALPQAALLTPADLEGNWRATGPEGDFPISASVARMAPACAPFVDLVFEGGAQHGSGAIETLAREDSVLYTYVVVFPTSDEAAAMLSAVSSREFDDCWSQYMGVVVPMTPFGITEAHYEKAEPPPMSFEADAYFNRHVTGTIVVDGAEADDTCVCVFAQTGRGVAIVHSALPHFTLEERVLVTQTAIDKLRDVLS